MKNEHSRGIVLVSGMRKIRGVRIYGVPARIRTGTYVSENRAMLQSARLRNVDNADKNNL
jgi:hypothetical protein